MRGDRKKVRDRIFRNRDGGGSCAFSGAVRADIQPNEDLAENMVTSLPVQSEPTYSPTKIVRTIKSITAKEIFKKHPEVKEKLWGGEFWSEGHYVGTVGKYGNEETITNYVKAQGNGKDYKQLYKIRKDNNQPSLFD